MTDDTLMTLPQVLAAVGLKKSKVYELIKNQQFPEPVKLGRLSRWSASAISAWIEEQKHKQQAKAA